jgi:uncharacterized protein
MRNLKDRYLSTFTGKKFFPFDPHPDQICIEDIAHGLSLICRFSGQCPFFFSVAEHSIYVAISLPEDLKLEGLLHDASEAFLADVPRPLKVGLPGYKAVELAVESVIAQKFGLTFPMPSEVKAADEHLLKNEIFTFFGPERYYEDFGEEYVSRGEHAFGFDPRTAEKKFLHLYYQLAETPCGPSDRAV